MSTDTETKITKPGKLGVKIVNEIPMKRWFSIRRRFDLNTDEIMQDAGLMMVVAANEHHRRQHEGRDGWEQFEDMTFEQLNDYLGMDADDEGEDQGGGDEDDEADKSADRTPAEQ